jgi:hypothetical protein
MPQVLMQFDQSNFIRYNGRQFLAQGEARGGIVAVHTRYPSMCMGYFASKVINYVVTNRRGPCGMLLQSGGKTGSPVQVNPHLLK